MSPSSGEHTETTKVHLCNIQTLHCHVISSKENECFAHIHTHAPYWNRNHHVHLNITWPYDHVHTFWVEEGHARFAYMFSYRIASIVPLRTLYAVAYPACVVLKIRQQETKKEIPQQKPKRKEETSGYYYIAEWPNRLMHICAYRTHLQPPPHAIIRRQHSIMGSDVP